MAIDQTKAKRLFLSPSGKIRRHECDGGYSTVLTVSGMMYARGKLRVEAEGFVLYTCDEEDAGRFMDAFFKGAACEIPYEKVERKR